MKGTRAAVVLCAAAALGVAAIGGGTAGAHPEHAGGLQIDDFAGEGVLGDKVQHPGDSGHLPPVNRNVTLVGKAKVSDRSVNGVGIEGKVADVAAYGDYAFLNAFRSPTCEGGGTYVIDVSDPANPVEVPGAFMPTSPGSFAGEGAQTLRVRNKHFDGVLFLSQSETCALVDGADAGGINIWDVSDARHPQALAMHAGDRLGEDGLDQGFANDTHSVFAWNGKHGRTYAALVDDFEATDIDILDITDPRNPVLINDTLDLNEPPFDVDQASPDNLTSVFSHDMTVKKIRGRYVMNMNYWDGGYVLLDVTDPRAGMVSLIAQSDYAALDEEQAARGREITPEGNAHQSEFSPDNRFLLGTDEDFAPIRINATIDGGPAAGTKFIATPAGDTPQLGDGDAIVGAPTYVGRACAVTEGSVIPPGSGIALIERGVCSFQEKGDAVTAAGYASAIVFNSVRPDCLARVSMLVTATIPMSFVNRPTGLDILGESYTDPCTTPTTATPGDVANDISIRAVFDGWGFVRLFRVNVPEAGAGSITDVDTYSIPEAQDPAYAEGFGDLSVHEVAMDGERNNIAYVSYYSGGLRVVKFGKRGIREVGAFIDEGGSNFWGVEMHKINGKRYVLASDRDYGLYIFKPYAGKKKGHG
jgi:hypothetical protein